MAKYINIDRRNIGTAQVFREMIRQDANGKPYLAKVISVVPPTPIVYDTDAQTFFNRLPDPITVSGKNIINAFVLAIKAAAGGITFLSEKFIKIHIRGGIVGSRANAKINLVQNAFDTTEILGSHIAWGKLGFVGDALGNGTFSYALDENWIAFTDGGSVYTLNDGAVGVYIHGNKAFDECSYGGTGDDLSSFHGALFAPKQATTNNSVLFCNDSFTGSTPNPGNIDGFWFNARTGANIVVSVRNGTLKETLTSLGTGLSKKGMYSLAASIDGAGSSSSPRPQSLLVVCKGTINYAAFSAAVSTLATDSDFNYDKARNAYFFGDSITLGVGATVRGVERWSTKICLDKGWIENNLGISGTSLQHAIPVDFYDPTNMYDRISEIPVYNSATDRALFFAYGMNDATIYDSGHPAYAPSNMESQLETILDAAIANGWPVGKIIVLTGTYADLTTWVGSNPANYISLQTAQQTAANNKGVIFINPYTYMANNGANALLDDIIHPNTAGYAAITNYALPYLSNL